MSFSRLFSRRSRSIQFEPLSHFEPNLCVIPGSGNTTSEPAVLQEPGDPRGEGATPGENRDSSGPWFSEGFGT